MFRRLHELFNDPRLRAGLAGLRLPIAVAVGVALIGLMDPRWLWPGMAISLAGEALQLWCFATLNKNTELVCQGPYALVRNPMYLGRFAAVLGASLLPGQWWLPVLVTVVYYFYVVNRVGREERRLGEFFGDSYGEYCSQVRRFLPGRPYPGQQVLVWQWSSFRRNHGWVNLAAALAFWTAAAAWALLRN